jgi:hypothetical protein
LKEEAIDLEVNGEPWQRVSSFDESSPEDKHYSVRIDDDGTASIRFGDGKHGARLPTGTTVINATHKHYSGVRLQQGRVQLDNNVDREMGNSVHLCGIYRGAVIDNDDPESHRRVLVQVPEVLGSKAIWALPCTPIGKTDLPAIGTGVWVMFEGGDPHKPVWVGTWTNAE